MLVEVKAFKLKWRKSKWRKTISVGIFHGAPLAYFPGTCLSRRFHSNLISKSRIHLKLTGTLSFYVLFLGLSFRNYLLSPKLNHGFSGQNTSSLKIICLVVTKPIFDLMFSAKRLNQNELHQTSKKYSERIFFTTESLRANENISIVSQKTNLNLTLREMNNKNHTHFSRLILLLPGDTNLNTGPTQTSETWAIL